MSKFTGFRIIFPCMLASSLTLVMNSALAANDTESFLLSEIQRGFSSVTMSSSGDEASNGNASSGSRGAVYCTNIRPSANLDGCDVLGISQEVDVTQHEGYYTNPNAPGCDLSLTMPGLPNINGMIDGMINSIDLCEMANEYLGEVSGKITDTINDKVNQSFSIGEDGSILGIVDVEGDVGVGLQGSSQTISTNILGNSTQSATTAPVNSNPGTFSNLYK